VFLKEKEDFSIAVKKKAKSNQRISHFESLDIEKHTSFVDRNQLR